MYQADFISRSRSICGCIFTAPVLVGLWLGSVEIQQAIYRAYEFVTCYDRSTLCTSIMGDLYPVCYSTPEKWGTEKWGSQKSQGSFLTPPVSTLRNNLDKYKILVCYSVDFSIVSPITVKIFFLEWGGRFCSTCNVCRTSENGVISVIACYPFSIPNLTRLFLIVSIQPCASRHITISKE